MDESIETTEGSLYDQLRYITEILENVSKRHFVEIRYTTTLSPEMRAMMESNARHGVLQSTFILGSLLRRMIDSDLESQAEGVLPSNIISYEEVDGDHIITMMVPEEVALSLASTAGVVRL